MRRYIPILLAVVLLGTIVTSLALAKEGSQQKPVSGKALLAQYHKIVKNHYKGHGAEYWHWQYKLEKKDHARTTKLLRKKTYRDVAYAISLASSTFGVPTSELWAVARCETGGTFNPYARNSSSSASGLFQFLDSTWANQGISGFSVYDPVANALGAARIVARQGWRQWVCKP